MYAKKANIVKVKQNWYNDENMQDIYDKDFLVDSLDDDMISTEEQGFMIGYLDGNFS